MSGDRGAAKLTQYLRLLMLAMAVLGCASTQDQSPAGTLVIDPQSFQMTEDGFTAWMAYGFFHSSQALSKDSAGQSEKYIPSLDQEAEARMWMVARWRELYEPEKRSDPYLKDLARVADSNFMPEYVWVYLPERRGEVDSDQLRLTEFETWRAIELPGHEARTLAAYQESRP